MKRLFAIIAVVFVVAACGQQAPIETTLQNLAQESETLHGQVVTTEGTVRMFDDPEHYWIEDGNLNRVSVEPQSILAGLVGAEIRVTGVFTASPDEGRSIEAQDIELLYPGDQ